MNKYIIGAIALGVLLLIGANIYSGDTGTAAQATEVSSPISVVGDGYDFGDINIFGGKVETTYTLTNEGSEDVVVTDAVTSCMCTEGVIAGKRFGMHGSEVASVVIPAGGEEVVTAIFDPLAHGPNGTGPIKRELQLGTNSSVDPTLRLTFSGTVIKEENN